MNYIRFFLLQLKRILKNKAYLILLLLFPICLFVLSKTYEAEEDSRIPVGLCVETDDILAETLCKKLTDREDSLFRFFEATSEESLTKLVQSNEIECGYLFRKPLLEELDRRHTKNLITVLVSENTTCKGVLNELVYANLFEEYSLHLLKETLKSAKHLPFSAEAAINFSLPAVTDEAIEKSYRSHLLNGETFTFDVTFLSSDVSEYTEGTSSTAVSLFRGLTALFLLLCGFLALLALHDDLTGGLYMRLHGIARPLCMILTMSSYLLPAGVISLFALGISGHLVGLGTELFGLLCYMLLLLVFYGVLGSLIRNRTMLCAAFPMLLLCTLVFTPVIVDLSTFFPWIKVVRYALPTYYYLLFF